jgi:N-acetylneuraminate synthase
MTAYPCPATQLGLNVIGEMRTRYRCRVGLSDHSGTIFAGLAAVTLGADALEVHVTFSRGMFGPDTPASVTFDDLRTLADGIAFIRAANAHPADKDAVAASLAPLRAIFARSIVASRDLAAGTALTPSDVALKKPGGGMPPSALASVLGRTLARDVARDAELSEQDLA